MKIVEVCFRADKSVGNFMLALPLGDENLLCLSHVLHLLAFYYHHFNSIMLLSQRFDSVFFMLACNPKRWEKMPFFLLIAIISITFENIFI